MSFGLFLMNVFFKNANNEPSISDKCPFFRMVIFFLVNGFLVGAALLFPSDLCAHISECFHSRKEGDSGASRQTSKAAVQGSSQF